MMHVPGTPEATPGLDRLREALARADKRSRPAADCSAHEMIWAAASGQLQPEEVRELLRHGAGCASCGQAWRLAADLIHASGSARASGSHQRAGIATAWAAAAAILILGSAALLLPAREPAPDAAYRSQGSDAITALVPDRAALPRAAFRLSWSAAGGRAHYQVTVATADLRTLHVSPWLTQTEHTVPKAKLADLPAGLALVWTVQTILADGRQVASPAFLVRLE